MPKGIYPHTKPPANKKEIRWIVDKNGCWICISHCRDRNGYPQRRLKINGKKRLYYISHLHYEKYKDKIPNGLFVLHKCDNPACINPEHLFLGTQKDNMNDKQQKGRVPHGENHCRSKLTENEVREIINLSLSQYKIAKIFNVGRGVIKGIKENKTWKHIERHPESVMMI